jgi:hypothetical protein
VRAERLRKQPPRQVGWSRSRVGIDKPRRVSARTPPAGDATRPQRMPAGSAASRDARGSEDSWAVQSRRDTVSWVVRRLRCAARGDLTLKVKELDYEWAIPARRGPGLGAIRLDRSHRTDVARWLEDHGGVRVELSVAGRCRSVARFFRADLG